MLIKTYFLLICLVSLVLRIHINFQFLHIKSAKILKSGVTNIKFQIVVLGVLVTTKFKHFFIVQQIAIP